MWHALYYRTNILVRFLLSRDKLTISIWLGSLSVFTVLLAVSLAGLYPDQADRDQLAETMINPAVTAMIGPGYGLDNYTFGAMFAHQMLGITALVVGIMGILLTVRYTRAEEEEGRLEIIRSLPSGRLSNLHAAVGIVTGMNVMLALVTGIGLYSLNIDSLDLEGSFLYGAVLGIAGIFFMAVTVLAAQLSESARGTLGLSFTVLGLAYLIRAIGDISNQTLSWFSPLGWLLGTEVYVNDYWWPLLLTFGAALALLLLAYYLYSIRDIGAGFLPSKPGKKEASVFLQHPTGFLLRLQRTGLISWSAAMLIFGATYGSVLGETEAFFEDMAMLEQLLPSVEGFSLTEQFLTMLMLIISLVSTIPALLALLRLKGEEKADRAEHLLTRSVSRYKLLGIYWGLSIVVGFMMLSLAAISMGLAGVSVLNGDISLWTFYSSALVYLPAMWIHLAVAVLFIGLAPGLSGMAWLYLGYSFLVGYLGELLQLPDWLDKFSPFSYIPKLPVEELAWFNMIFLTLLAVTTTIVGFIFYRKRDIGR